jgi:hypothetical protein
MPRKLTPQDHLGHYRADLVAGKIEPGKARLVKIGSGVVCLHIAGPNSCRWRYSYRHQGKLTTAFWPAIGPAAISEKEAEAERNALWLEHYKQRREAREARKAGLPEPVAPAHQVQRVGHGRRAGIAGELQVMVGPLRSKPARRLG